MTVILYALLILLGLIAALALIAQALAVHARRRLAPHGARRRVTGGEIHYVASGDGPPVVMIHGLGANLRHFTHGLSAALATDHRVIALDRPGSGWSTRDGAAQADVAEQARMIAEFIRAEGLERPVIVGHSLGGAIALAVAARHPDVVSGVALLCPLTRAVAETPDVFKGLEIPSPLMRRVVGHVLVPPMGVLTQRRVLDAIFAPEPPVDDFMARAGGYHGWRPEIFLATAEDLAAAKAAPARLQGAFGDIKAPVSILFGAEDALLDPGVHGRDLCAEMGWTYEVLEGRGHMIPITAPEACAALIRRAGAGRLAAE